MKWFNNPKTCEELKKQYKRLAMEHHPDRGGSTKDMQEINAEYERLFARLKDVHATKDGETYTSRTASTETPQEFMDIIDALIKLHMERVTVEICGSWLWLTGNTKPYREDIKRLSFRWSSNKSAWYFHRDGYKKKGDRYLSMDEIRGFYGSTVVNSSGKEDEEKNRISA